MLLQLLAGGIAAIGVTAKLYWRRLSSFFRFRKRDEVRPEHDSAT